MVSIFKKRIIAYIADYFVVSAIMWILAEILAILIIPYSMFIIYNYFIIIAPIAGIIYFVLLEKTKGTTVGKHLMFLKVVSIKNTEETPNNEDENENKDNESTQQISYKQAIVRNLSKIYWVPIIFDVIIGKYYGNSDERILGQLSKTKVVDE
ncbi:RDD family protein [Methanobrevibacter cuticularis]|uniref:RDD family protein n=1 Tax=Methanobrevibacter cuticularis TaxID=47311 RepID=A0A166ELU5_9EURY|nr:RDD family protein [Methanobrevibacter cuticularis]KZX16795.1 RDD family protein [Methanobrevibacter cuticularis]